MEHYLTTPLQNEDINKLQIGDKVFISGKVYTARDAVHKKLIELLEKGQVLPFQLQGAVIYYVGPALAPPGLPIGSAGPTTSYRMDPFTPTLLKAGVKAMIGKGPRSPKVISAIKNTNSVYLAAIGGAAVVVAQAVKSSKVIAYPELGPEAIYELEVENLPCYVAINSSGKNIYEQ
ncbi:MAG: Fe-S-containing hydro-lyase [Candidatus Cloacimonadota bacterium]|nr:Fe-S-containing hydro-lyase [Candidatus Cloacimonadota bacterium]